MHNGIRHPKWNDIMGFLDNVAENLGSSINDARCGKNWDPGQAMCAEAYGPNWQNDPTFIEWNNKPDSEPPEPHFYKCAKKMAGGYVPDWVVE